MDSQQTRFFDLLHHETADFVVVGRLAPRAADGNDLLSARTYNTTAYTVKSVATSSSAAWPVLECRYPQQSTLRTTI